MPKANNTIRLGLVTLLVFSFQSVVHAQMTLEDVIEQAKQQKRRESAPPALASATSNALKETDHPHEDMPKLWSLSGVNDKLTAEIWQGDVVHHLPLRIGARLSSGWIVKAFDRQSITFQRGKNIRTLAVALRGSTGWEFSQMPRASITPVHEATNSFARTAASNLPPVAMPPMQKNMFQTTP
jgi:hypothetical protein